jgi:hypothetical protein
MKMPHKIETRAMFNFISQLKHMCNLWFIGFTYFVAETNQF